MSPIRKRKNEDLETPSPKLKIGPQKESPTETSLYPATFASRKQKNECLKTSRSSKRLQTRPQSRTDFFSLPREIRQQIILYTFEDTYAYAYRSYAVGFLCYTNGKWRRKRNPSSRQPRLIVVSATMLADKIDDRMVDDVEYVYGKIEDSAKEFVRGLWDWDHGEVRIGMCPDWTALRKVKN